MSRSVARLPQCVQNDTVLWQDYHTYAQVAVISPLSSIRKIALCQEKGMESFYYKTDGICQNARKTWCTNVCRKITIRAIQRLIVTTLRLF